MRRINNNSDELDTRHLSLDKKGSSRRRVFLTIIDWMIKRVFYTIFIVFGIFLAGIVLMFYFVPDWHMLWKTTVDVSQTTTNKANQIKTQPSYKLLEDEVKGLDQISSRNTPTAKESSTLDYLIFKGEREEDNVLTETLAKNNYQSESFIKTWGWIEQNHIDFTTLSDIDLLEKLAQAKVENLFLNKRYDIGNSEKTKKSSSSTGLIKEQQEVGKHLTPYPIDVFKTSWDPNDTIMSKNISEVENHLVYVLKELIKNKSLFNDDEENAYRELKKLIPKP